MKAMQRLIVNVKKSEDLTQSYQAFYHDTCTEVSWISTDDEPVECQHWTCDHKREGTMIPVWIES